MGVGIHHKNGLSSCIQYNGISGFRANTLDREQLSAQFIKRQGKQGFQTAVMLLGNENQEIAQAACLDVVVPCWADVFGQNLSGQGQHGGQVEQAGLLEVRDSLFNVFPVGVLGQDGAHYHLKGSLPWPPILRTKVFV